MQHLKNVRCVGITFVKRNDRKVHYQKRVDGTVQVDEAFSEQEVPQVEPRLLHKAVIQQQPTKRQPCYCEQHHNHHHHSQRLRWNTNINYSCINLMQKQHLTFWSTAITVDCSLYVKISRNSKQVTQRNPCLFFSSIRGKLSESISQLKGFLHCVKV